MKIWTKNRIGNIEAQNFANIAGILFLIFLVLALSAPSHAADDNASKSSSMIMMERIETIVYGEANKGGLIERLNSIEKELFGRELPGSISERHTATLNFLETGTADQPSMLFKLGVAEWIVGNVQPRKSAMARVETLETDLDGVMRYGEPLAMRVERILSSLVAETVTSQEAILPNATVLRAKFLEELGPAKSKKGDKVGLALTQDLFVGKILIAPKGSLIDTFVREVKQPRAFGVPGEVRLQFNSLVSLGPRRPLVTFSAAAKKATDDEKKFGEKGEGSMIGAGAASIGGVILLGPVGILGGALIRGNAIKIPEGSIMFLEVSGDFRVSGYPVPEGLQIDPSATIKESIVPVTKVTTTTTTVTTTVGAAPAQSVKSDGSITLPPANSDGSITLPPEQKVD
ncbi:hypothetical protein AGMMS50276_28930 [Synergistales bacterium]|nr:hypothetical protein AGMMS50276_28930 [Synergistales bacterium]